MSAATVLGLGGLTASALWFGWTDVSRRETVSPRALVSFLMVLHFCLPGLLAVTGVVSAPSAVHAGYWPEASWFVLLTYLAFLLGIAFVRHLPGLGLAAHRILPRTRPRPAALRVYALILLTVGWCARAYVLHEGAYFQTVRTGSLGPHHAIVRFLELLPWYALAFLFLADRLGTSTASRRGHPLVLRVYWIVEFLYWAGAGRKFEAILALGWPLVVAGLFGSRLPRRALLTLGAVAVLLFPATFYYRAALLDRDGLDAGGIARGVVRRLESPEVTGEMVTITMARLNLLESVAAAVRLVDRGRWPLRSGEDYLDIVLNMVPRALWREKPDFQYGNEFGRAAGILSPSDHSTSVSVTYIGESYLNLGWLGWVVFFWFGMAIELLWIQVARGDSHLARLLYLCVLPSWIYLGGTAALYVAGAVKATGLLVMGYWVFSRVAGSTIPYRRAPWTPPASTTA